eukprot:CAMPEP_0118677724 /NCGR_PEP_ID=MMETSP0800-20121206/2794_1 /TAXON_ID=210618 ORGANISM="Striatella unipunctata, Strain CCMP2910" /NCGR_SAMPLE_ID=MMETSP0800 /ASSEMBLY_ACC=CAM_ASM_000638 /LENGTH=55 /DNA_ID=CAMNT_0006573445 /DNA_START=44 /DNA_END=211 /DNA_ORIENTATION=-
MTTPVEYGINALKLLLAFSPLLALAYVLLSGFETDEQENMKRKKKTDFELDGHAE